MRESAPVSSDSGCSAAIAGGEALGVVGVSEVTSCSGAM